MVNNTGFFVRYRAAVRAFAQGMLLKLLKNQHKGEWETNNLKFYMAKLKAEVYELAAEIELMETLESEGEYQDANLEALVKECHDVANFAMMVSIVAARRFDVELVEDSTKEIV